MTIPVTKPCAQIGTHLAGHRRRVADDPSKRHAAVAIVLVDSERGEDRIDPAVGHGSAGDRCPTRILTAAWSTSPAAPRSCCAAGRPG